jgi:hypothetical protein
MAATPAAADTTPLRWHRFNVADSPPSHERLSCLTDGQWRCRYDKVPEPTLGFSWDQTTGVFTGTEVTGTWECPAWFPSGVCDSATQVISGTLTYTAPQHRGTFTVDAELIVTGDGALWLYWVDAFVCPWYPTFGQALTSPADCIFNPTP